jgi:predicted TIM-barrel fold metal-dependent hydrolase
LIFPHVNGEFIDGKKYWPIFERAAALNVPLYIHPTFPPLNRKKQYSGYPELAGSPWGFAAEAGLGVVRLICSGIFDEYPNLKVILGHLGEALPFWMWRLDNCILRQSDATLLTKKLKKLPSQYIRDNFFVTTSGMNWQPALLCTHLALGADKILFAADYPFESSDEAVQFMETASISDSDKEKIFHLNTEKLLGL